MSPLNSTVVPAERGDLSAIPFFLLANALLLVGACRAASRKTMIHLPDDLYLRAG